MWRTIIDLVELFAILAPAFWLLERFAGGRKRIVRAGLVTDLSYWMFTPLVTRWLTNNGVIVCVFLVGIAMGFGPRDIPHHGFGPVLRQPIFLQAIEIIVLSDLIAYWIHRLFHGGRFWHFHAVHHSPVEVDWMTTQRVHPFNDVFLRVAQAVPLFVMGFAPTILALYHLLDIFYAFLVHADVNWTFGPLRYVLVSPAYHRWHHSKRPEAIDKNFATVFPVWDLIFGTLYLPSGDIPSDFGVQDRIPENLFGQMVYPFVPARHSIESAPVVTDEVTQSGSALPPLLVPRPSALRLPPGPTSMSSVESSLRIEGSLEGGSVGVGADRQPTPVFQKVSPGSEQDPVLISEGYEKSL